MKKILYLLLLIPLWASAQVSNGTQQFFDYGIQVEPAALQIPSTTDWIGTFGADGTQGKIFPENISMNVIPPTTHYIPTSPNLKGHFQGIDAALGNISATTAGVTTRVWYTADPTSITAGTFYLTNPVNKGTAASAIQNVVNNDNEKKYFTQDLIGNPFATATIFPPGVYAGNLSASTSPNSAQQRYTVELYKCNNAGTPIASGVSGAPVGSLGVTVVVILDSGLLTLADNSVTNVPTSGSLAGQFSIAVGERIRYHVSAEKVGTAGGNITQSVYYGTSYNSFLDVPVTFNTSSVVNVSGVTGATTTDALNTLNARTMQQNYNSSLSPQITTDNILGPVAFKNGSGFDFNYNLVSQNNSGVNTFSVDGNGNVLSNNLLDKSSAQTVAGVKTYLDGNIGYRNAANTFTSFFTNANTAARTYTLPDASGTIALTSNTFSSFQTLNVSTYTFVLADANSVINSVFSASNSVFTVPTNSVVAFPIGTTIKVFRSSGIPTSTLTISGAGVTFIAPSGLIGINNCSFVLTKVLTDTWAVQANVTGVTASANASNFTGNISAGSAGFYGGFVAVGTLTNGGNSTQIGLGTGGATITGLSRGGAPVTEQVGMSDIITFNPTGGAGGYTSFKVSPVINQTGGSGIVRGLYVNPTLTSTIDFRAIEATTGSIVLPYLAKSATYAISNNDYLLDFTSGTFTATLPTAVGCTGKNYVLKNSGSGAITIATTSSQTIDGSTTYNLATQYKYVHVVSNGANWIITANN